MEYDEIWSPRCAIPPLVVPVRLDRAGESGPTRHMARRGRWRRATYGWHVGSGVERSVEQRILEESMRLGGRGAVTGWAALRLRGVAYCDGEPDRPVALVSPRQLANTPGSVATRERVGEVEWVHGVPCAPIARAVADELCRLGDPRAGVVLLDMCFAARVTSIKRLTAAASRLPRRKRVPLLGALALADEHSASPRESLMRLVWTLDAGLPRPLCNRLVYDLEGRVLGKPDLLDPELGVVGEYDGAAHRSRARHRRDTERLEAFRRCGLEDFTIVAGDDVATQVRRMRAARARAAAQVGPRRWTLTPPPGAWVPNEPSLDDELDLIELMRADREAGM
jgi:hypothetical protein